MQFVINELKPVTLLVWSYKYLVLTLTLRAPKYLYLKVLYSFLSSLTTYIPLLNIVLNLKYQLKVSYLINNNF